MKISSEVARSNYTILFFWYADCSYCHGQIPDLLRIYNTYKSKGLEVIGISIDTEKGKWISGIKAKNMPWLHLSDLKGWKSTAIQTYKIHKTPGYYLLDKNMKIVSKPTHVRAIESQLKHLF